MKITNKYNLPEPVVRAILNDPYSRGDADFSVTELIDSPRIRALKAVHDEDIVEDVSDMVFSLFGRAMHSILETGAGDDHTAEQRLYTVVDGYRVSGGMDLQIHGDGTVGIRDYKVTTVYSFQSDKTEWHKQLNLYAHLVRVNRNVDVRDLGVVAFLRDWQSRNRANTNYPPAPIQTMDNIPLWAPEVCEAYLKERVRVHAAAHANAFSGSGLVECTDEERWKSPDVYAVIKKGGIRAKSVFPTRSSAEAFLCDLDDEGYEIQVRRGDVKRCAGNWCKVAMWCDQYMRENVR